MNPHKLYKNKENGIIGGVCAGIADYFGLSTFLIRFIAVLCLMATFPLTFIVYIILYMSLDVRPDVVYESEEEEKFWRKVSFSPSEKISEMRYRLQKLSDRIKKLENFVTEQEFSNEDKFKNL